MRAVLLLGLCCLLTSCAPRRPQPPASDGRIRILKELPRGVRCERMKQLRLRDGVGCGYTMTGSAQGQRVSLMYNLRRKARMYKANVIVVTQDPQPDEQQPGCPRFGLVMEADLFACDYTAAQAP